MAVAKQMAVFDCEGELLPPTSIHWRRVAVRALSLTFLGKALTARESIFMKTTILKNMILLTITVLGQLTAVAVAGATSETDLAASSAGRIVLHLLCAGRDHHFRWHWQGVVREFAKM